MKIEITPTDDFLPVQGQPCRVWDGRSEEGVECYVLVRGLAVPTGPGQSEEIAKEFKRELFEIENPDVEDTGVRAIDVEVNFPAGLSAEEAFRQIGEDLGQQLEELGEKPAIPEPETIQDLALSCTRGYFQMEQVLEVMLRFIRQHAPAKYPEARAAVQQNLNPMGKDFDQDFGEVMAAYAAFVAMRNVAMEDAHQN